MNPIVVGVLHSCLPNKDYRFLTFIIPGVLTTTDKRWVTNRKSFENPSTRPENVHPNPHAPIGNPYTTVCLDVSYPIDTKVERKEYTRVPEAIGRPVPLLPTIRYLRRRTLCWERILPPDVTHIVLRVGTSTVTVPYNSA